MITLSFKINKKKIAICIVALVAVVSAFTYARSIRENSDNISLQTTASQTIKVKKGKAKTNEQRVEFIRQFGWEIESEPSEVMQVVLPEQLDEVYQKYNSIQKKQGFNLEKYLGKQATRYTYPVKNYPKHPEFVQANLLVYRDTIIAGDVCSVELNGFMHGLQMTECKIPQDDISAETTKEQ